METFIVIGIAIILRIYLGYDEYRLLSPSQKDKLWKQHGLQFWTQL